MISEWWRSKSASGKSKASRGTSYLVSMRNGSLGVIRQEGFVLSEPLFRLLGSSFSLGSSRVQESSRDGYDLAIACGDCANIYGDGITATEKSPTHLGCL